MKNVKQKSYFTNVEDKYVFKVSTAFWHLLIGVITLAAVVGIVIFAWALIPSSLDKVKAAPYPVKAAYPPVSEINLDDISKKEEKLKVYKPTKLPPPIYTAPVKSENDPDKASYDLTLLELKKIIPHDEWQPGSWSYPYGELAWEMHQTDQYRNWIPSGDNIEQRLETSYNKISVRKYASKKSALNSYLKILRNVPQKHSVEVLNTIIYGLNKEYNDLHLLDSTFNLIGSGLDNFPSSQRDAAQLFINLALNNPNAIFGFMPFALKTCLLFPEEARYKVLTELNSGFYNYFNRNAEIQKEATQQFDKLAPQLVDIDPDQALSKFYTVYLQKNSKRNDEINKINLEYNSKIYSIIADSTLNAISAQARFVANKEKKNQMRTKSMYAIGGGFIGIALLGTILTLLSIQRILKRLEIVVENKVKAIDI